MRTVSELPRRRGRFAGRSRVVLVVIAIALFIFVTSLRGIARFYTDFLWFRALDLSSVWRTTLMARISLGLLFTGLFFVLMWLNLVIADRLAPRFRPAGPEQELLERYQELVGRRAGLIRIVASLIFALIVGAGVSNEWRSWLLFINRESFGVKDPLMNTDVGFFVFQLPFLSFVVSWLFAAFFIILIVIAVAHYLNGGIRVQTSGQRVTPQVKAHLSVLLGVLALVKAADYFLQQFELTLSSRGVVDGATFTDVNAQLPAIRLLLLISLFAFALFLVNIRWRGWVLPALAVGLWAFVAVVAGEIYPTLIQRFQVEPAESRREAKYIERNIEGTLAAMGLAEVTVTPFVYNDELTAKDLDDNAGTVDNIRLLDPTVVDDTYQRLQGQQPYYHFTDLDVDRYEIDGRTTQVVISARELNERNLPATSWEAEHLIYTQGYGVTMAAANEVDTTGNPVFSVRDVPVEVRFDLPIERPEIYHGEGMSGYSIVQTDRVEVNGTSNVRDYDGDGGVQLNSLFKQAAFALRFWRIDPLISGFITPESRVLYIRDIRERVETVAPFLHFDHDPYPIVVGGRIVYMIDGYTTTSNYPYAQRADTSGLKPGSGLRHRFNYVRNSVKAVVDAYDGSVTLYVIDEDDPIVRVWRKAFPDLFEPGSAMDPELRAHLRYPEDLFTVQTNMWSRYHIEDPNEFYQQDDGWLVAVQPPSEPGEAIRTAVTNVDGIPVTGQLRADRVDPYYLQIQLPDAAEEDFLILRPFVPVSQNSERQELTAFMVAKSDPGRYGEIEVFTIPTREVPGPAIIGADINKDQEISQLATLLGQRGSSVLFGDLLLVPIESSIVYVRPMYVKATGDTTVPELTKVIVAYGTENRRIEMADTLDEALEKVFGPGAGGTPDPDGEPSDPDGGPDDGPPPTTTPDAIPGDRTVEQVLDDAVALFDEADTALRNGDLATYQQKIDEASALLDEALQLLQAAEAPEPTTPPTTEEDDQA